MASAFYVNLEHLGYFEQQVGRNLSYARRATEVMDLWQLRNELSAPGDGGTGVSAAALVIPLIKEWLDRAEHDNESAIKALGTSAESLHYSAEYYQKLDDDRRAELDRLYNNTNYGKALTTAPIGPAKFSLPGAQPIKLGELKGWRSDDTPRTTRRKTITGSTCIHSRSTTRRPTPARSSARIGFCRSTTRPRMSRTYFPPRRPPAGH
jgi:hypothetical protein